MYKKHKDNVKNLIRLIFLSILPFVNISMDNYILWTLLCFIIIYILPECLSTLLMINNKYDGTFVIDETNPTDVKIKLVMDTEAEDLANCNDILIKIDVRDENLDYNEGDDFNEKRIEKNENKH